MLTQQSLSCCTQSTTVLQTAGISLHRKTGEAGIPNCKSRYCPGNPCPQSCHLREQPHMRQMPLLCRAFINSVTSDPLSPELKSALESFVQQHNVVLFMKGTKQFPQVGPALYSIWKPPCNLQSS